jgi:ribosomal protein S18 acetylase RimI-like enzyme
MAAPARPRSVIWETNLEVLPRDRVIERRDGLLVVRSPSNPLHWWGNLILFDRVPQQMDGRRWEERFAAEFAIEPRVRHRSFAWDVPNGELGNAEEEFVARGYELDETVGLTARAAELRAHRRENREVAVRELHPGAGRDEQLWSQVIDLQLSTYEDPLAGEAQRDYCRTRQGHLRELFRAGRGGWYVALAPGDEEVLGSLGIVVTTGRGRFQAVDTAPAHQRQGICSRLLVEAVQINCERYGASSFVIGADPGYHAMGLYESLGFRAVERTAGVCRQSP